MKLTYAQFNFQVREKSYAVQMGIQISDSSATTVSVTIIGVTEAGTKRVISSKVARGRQIVSPHNAEKMLREALIADGVIKAREKKVVSCPNIPAPPPFACESLPELEKSVQTKRRNFIQKIFNLKP